MSFIQKKLLRNEKYKTGKAFAKQLSDKRLVSRIYKEFYNSIRSRKAIQFG